MTALREYAQAEGYGVVDEWVFRDEGYSGATLVRPGLERVRDLAAEGEIEAVLVYGPDRLSRRYAYQVLLLEEFARNGVEVVFLSSPQANTPEEELLVQFQGMIAEYERAQITERTRRGKRHRAKGGSVNVLSGAPYGYRYVKKTQTCEAYYERIDSEAAVVREVYRLYTVEALTIGGIVQWLESQGVSTRKGKSPWERSTVWQMLRNPAYKGTACFGKTQIVPHTQEPTLLQGMLVCRQCGYAYYRTSTRTSKRKLYYYRCLGSDDYRYANGRVCESRPIRQDSLDALVWRHVLQLLEDPTVIRSEIDRRLREIQKSSPTKCRKETLVREENRLQNGIDKILDAYQEGLLSIDELRDRVPSLRKRQGTIQSELRSLDQQTADEQTVLRLAQNIEGFLSRLRQSAEHLEVIEQQKILRLIVKEILVGSDVVTIKHSIPVGNGHSIGTNPPSYLLCTRSD